MLRIRLSRVGKRKQPSYRLVVADSRAPRDGAFIEIIGHYNPRTEPATLVVKEEEAIHWLRRGAQPSDTAAKLLTRLGVMGRAGRAAVVWDRKTAVRPKKAAAEAPAATAGAAPAAVQGAPAQAVATVEEPAPEAEAPVEEAAEEAEAAAGEQPEEPEAAAENSEAGGEPKEREPRSDP